MGSQKLGNQDEIGGTYIGAIGHPGKEFAFPQGKQLLIEGYYFEILLCFLIFNLCLHDLLLFVVFIKFFKSSLYIFFSLLI